MQLIGSPLYTLCKLLGRTGLIFNAESYLAVRIHIEKLRAGILEHAPHLFRNAVHRHFCDIFTVKKHLALQLALKKLRDKSVHKPCESCFSAAAPSAENDKLTVGNSQINVVQTALRAVGICKGNIFEFYHWFHPFSKSPLMKNAANTAMTMQSAALIFITVRQVRCLGFSMPLVTEATESSSAVLEAAISSGT